MKGGGGLQVAVEVDDRDGTVSRNDAAEDGKRDSVIAAEGDDAGEGRALLGVPLLAGIGKGRAGEELAVALFDLLDGVDIVVAGFTLDGYWCL